MTAVDILISSALPAPRGLFKNIMTDSPVQKAFMASCFEVAETQLRGDTRLSLSPLLHALKAATIRPASCSGLYNKRQGSLV